MEGRYLEPIYVRRSWQDVEKDCHALYEKVKEDFVPDVLVAIARGGWLPARILCDRFSYPDKFEYDSDAKKWKIPMRHPYVFNIGLKRHTSGRMEWFQPLMQEAFENLKGKKVLVVDDVLEGGASMSEVVRRVHSAEPEMLGAGILDFKCLFPEEWKKANTRNAAMKLIKALTHEHFYYVNEREVNNWMLYQWGIKENSMEIYKRFGEEGFEKTLPINSPVEKEILNELEENFHVIDVEKQKMERRKLDDTSN